MFSHSLINTYRRSRLRLKRVSDSGGATSNLPFNYLFDRSKRALSHRVVFTTP